MCQRGLCVLSFNPQPLAPACASCSTSSVQDRLALSRERAVVDVPTVVRCPILCDKHGSYAGGWRWALGEDAHHDEGSRVGRRLGSEFPLEESPFDGVAGVGRLEHLGDREGEGGAG